MSVHMYICMHMHMCILMIGGLLLIYLCLYLHVYMSLALIPSLVHKSQFDVWKCYGCPSGFVVDTNDFDRIDSAIDLDEDNGGMRCNMDRRRRNGGGARRDGVCVWV